MAADAEAASPSPSEPSPPSPDMLPPPQQHPRPRCRLRRPLSVKQRALAEAKRAVLAERVRFSPFSGCGHEFDAHETTLRSLGLWEFAALDWASPPLDESFIASLVAYYDPRMHRSFVRGIRVSVSRTDLAKALCLPGKKEPQLEVPPAAVPMLLDLMWRTILFPFEEDACILPPEVAEATEKVREGNAGRVDWAGLVWGLVEKEIAELNSSGHSSVCHYASHLQRLIWFQRPELFESSLHGEVHGDEEDEMLDSAVDEDMEEEDDTEQRGDEEEPRIDDDEDDSEGTDEDAEPDLILGIGVDEEDGVNGSNCIESANGGNEEENDRQVGHCFQRCDSLGFGGMDFDNLAKGDADMEDLDDRFNGGYSGKMSSFERLESSSDLLQPMSAMNIPFGSSENLHASGSDFLAIGQEAQKTFAVGTGVGSPFFLTDSGKRPIRDEDVDSDDAHHHPHRSNMAKRIRVDGNCEFGSPSFNATVIEPIRTALAKGSILYEAKEQELINARMEIQYLRRMVEEKDQIIHSLENAGLEQQRKWQMELCRFEHESHVMAQMVVGYKKALKQTNASFTEYRKKCSQAEKLLYRDVPDSGGLVLSVRECEKLRLEREEQMRTKVRLMIDNFAASWFAKVDCYSETVSSHQRRIEAIGKEIDLLKERKRKQCVGSDDVVDCISATASGFSELADNNE